MVRCTIREVMLVVVLASASPALADRGAGASFDFGYAHSRVAVTDQSALSADGARFGIRIASGARFHFGAEVEEAWFGGDAPRPNGTLARETGGGGGSVLAGPLEGNTLELKGYAGLHALAGPVMFGGEAALGLRDSSVSTDAGEDIAGFKKQPLLQLRVRAEAFVTESTTVGAVASTDLFDSRNVTIAAVVAMNFTR